MWRVDEWMNECVPGGVSGTRKNKKGQKRNKEHCPVTHARRNSLKKKKMLFVELRSPAIVLFFEMK
jgi:hypothetical protein